MRQKASRITAIAMVFALCMTNIAATTTQQPDSNATTQDVTTSSNQDGDVKKEPRASGEPFFYYFPDYYLAEYIAMHMGRSVYDSVTISELSNLNNQLWWYSSRLDITDARIRSLEGIEYISSLQELYVSDTSITTLPASIGKLRNLQSIYLYNNRITSLPSSIGDLTQLRTLNVYEPRLYSIPSSMENMFCLQNLTISSDVLTAVPDAIGKISSLETLGIHSGKLNRLPDTIGQLSNLKSLSIGGNVWMGTPSGTPSAILREDAVPAPIKTLPNSLGNLMGLNYLSISGTSLDTIPTWVDGMSSLETLYIAMNPNVTNLSNDIGNLYNLRFANFSDNNLFEIPAHMANLKALQTLDVSGNHISELPDGVVAHFTASPSAGTSSGRATGSGILADGLWAQKQQAALAERSYLQGTMLTWEDVLPRLMTQILKTDGYGYDYLATTSATIWVKHTTDASDTRSYPLAKILATNSSIMPNDLFKQAGTYQITLKTANTPLGHSEYEYDPWGGWWIVNYRWVPNNFAGHDFNYTIEIKDGVPPVQVPSYAINTIATTQDGQYKITIKGDIEETLADGFHQLTSAQVQNQMLSFRIQNNTTGEMRNAAVGTLNDIYVYVKNGQITGVIFNGNAKTPNGTKEIYSILLGQMG